MKSKEIELLRNPKDTLTETDFDRRTEELHDNVEYIKILIDKAKIMNAEKMKMSITKAESLNNQHI